jgi:hypothetical protein
MKVMSSCDVSELIFIVNPLSSGILSGTSHILNVESLCYTTYCFYQLHVNTGNAVNQFCLITYMFKLTFEYKC